MNCLVVWGNHPLHTLELVIGTFKLQDNKEKNRDTMFRKERIAFLVFTVLIVVHKENQKDSTGEISKLINIFCKVTRYKINIKLIICLYTNNIWLKSAMENDIFHLVFTISYLKPEISVNRKTKVVQVCDPSPSPQKRNYKAFLGEIEDLNKWR